MPASTPWKTRSAPCTLWRFILAVQASTSQVFRVRPQRLASTRQ